MQHLLPGSSDLAELTETIKMLRDALAPAATLIELRYWRARCNDLDEKLIGLSRRGEVRQPFRPSPDAPEDVPHWREPFPVATPAALIEHLAVVRDVRDPVAEAPRPADELSPRRRFRAARWLLGLSQAAMAARIGSGWTAAMVSQVETARRLCPADVLVAVERMAILAAVESGQGKLDMSR